MTLGSKTRSDRMGAIFATLVVASCAYFTSATAQPVYKCGATYSEIPCPDGQPIETKDTRTPQQSKQAQVATEKNWAQAQALEKKRVAEEASAQKQERATGKAQTKAKDTSVEKTKSTKSKASKKKAPEYFTASAEKPPKGTKP